jgi:tight adherence protein B
MMGAVLVVASDEGFWASTASLVLVAAACGLLVGVTVALILYVRRGRGGVTTRVGEFLSSSSHAAQPASEGELRRIMTRTEKSLARERWWDEFNQNLELARIERPAIEIVYLTGGCTFALALLLLLASGSALLAVLVLIAGPLFVRWLINFRVRRQRMLFAEQLPGNLDEICSALRAGQSIVAAIATTVESAPEPTRSELRRVVADEQLGLPLEEALRSVAVRMRATDVEQVALVAQLQSRTGGSAAEVLERVAEGVRSRAELNRELRALTAQARLSRNIVATLPLLLLLFLDVSRPHYVSPFFDTALGNFLLVSMLCLVAAGFWIMSRIARVEV